MKQSLTSHLKNFPPKFLLIVSLATLFFVGLLALYLELVSEIFEQEMNVLDTAAFALSHSWESPYFATFMLFITQTGSPFFLFLLSLPILAWIYTEKYRVQTYLLFFTAFMGGGLLNVLLKNIYQRERPLLDDAIGAYGYSLPSGHAMVSMIFYGAITYLAFRSKGPRWLTFLLFFVGLLMVLLIGMSRVYLQAHYFSDVLAGYMCGLLWLGICIAVFDGRRLYRKYVVDGKS